MNRQALQIGLPSNATQAELIAAANDAPDSRDYVFRHAILNKLPDSFAEVIAKQYTRIYKATGRRSANLFMLDIKDQLTTQIISLAASDDEIVSYAKSRADEMLRLSFYWDNIADGLQCLCDIAYFRHGINPPLKTKLGSESENVKLRVPGKDDFVIASVYGVSGRLFNERWWRRALRNVHIRSVEKKAIELGLVRQGKEKYVSNVTLRRKRQQKQRNKRVLENCFATNENNQTYTLQELSDKTVSNPTIQRNELMTRLAGFDEIAKEQGHEGVMLTITTPSKMHASVTNNNKAFNNPNYDGTTPAQAQKYLTLIWSRMRAQFNRQGIKPYGFRVAEPHHDATPHWHVLLYGNAIQLEALEQIVRNYALEDSPNEPGAQKHRVTAVRIDRSKGSGVSYLSKYISKSIDGYGLDMDIDGGEPTKAAEKVKAWATTWGIRQFQQIGGPPVSLWRELRKASGEGLGGVIKTIWNAANEGLWGTFVKLMGGTSASRKELPITLAKQWNDEPNCYREPKGAEVIGISHGSVTIPTRLHQWVITNKFTNPLANILKVNF